MPIAETIIINYPAWFKEALTTDKRYIDVWGGRGRGGSHTGTNYFLDLITSPEYFRGYFVRQSFNDIRSSLFQDFKDRIEENPTIDISDFRIQDNEMRITYNPTGNMIISKGVKKDGSRTAKMKSLAGATHVLIEEADEMGEADFLQLDDSLRTVKAASLQIIRIFNPPGKGHWIWRDYILSESPVEEYFKATPRSDSNVLSLFATHRSNMRNMADSTLRKFLSYKAYNPEYYYTVICGLISQGMRGRIHNGWIQITDDQFNAIDERSIIGLDFGENTGGIVEVKFQKSNDVQNAYVRELYYGGGSAKDIGIKLASLGIKNEIIIADSAEPTKIAKLRNGWTITELLPHELEQYPQLLKGFNIHPVAKPAGSVTTGIGMVKGYKTHLTESSKNFWNEYLNYKWALDKNKNPTDAPEKSSDHCFAAGTIVTCIDGLKPIETITDKDSVLTRIGFKRVVSGGKTGYKPTIHYTFNKQYSITCTPNHKIYTTNGFKEVKDLLPFDVLVINSIETPISTIEVRTGGIQTVYDLTIDEQHEYYANGILVSNCHDPYRYVVFSRQRHNY